MGDRSGRGPTDEEASLFEDAVMRISGKEIRGKYDRTTKSRQPRRQNPKTARGENAQIEIDLHGFTRDAAIELLRTELIRHKGVQGWIRVVVGQGHNSEAGGVLKKIIPEWLAGPGHKYAAEVAPAKQRDGGAGAILVRPRGFS